MKKSEIMAILVAGVTDRLSAKKVKGEIINEITDFIKDSLKTVSTSTKVNIEDVTQKDEAGNIVKILCSKSGIWLDATIENFYEAKNNTAGIEVNGVKLRRLSRKGESISKAFNRQKVASENAIRDDVLNGVISVEEGKEKLAAIPVTPDYSAMQDSAE